MRSLGYVVGAVGVLGLCVLVIGTSTLFYFAWSGGYWVDSLQFAGWNLVLYLESPTIGGNVIFVEFPWWFPLGVAALLGCAWALLTEDARQGDPGAK